MNRLYVYIGIFDVTTVSWYYFAGDIVKLKRGSKRQREEETTMKVKRSKGIVMDDVLELSSGSDFDPKEEGESESQGNVFLVEETSVESESGDCFGSSEEKVSYREGEGPSTGPMKRKKAFLGRVDKGGTR